MKKNVVLLELNEFNADLLEATSKEMGLKNIQKLVSLPKTQTMTSDTYESDWLEPWVQWVSIHTGKASSEHKIKHLGDVPHLGIEQIWERLSKKGISSGIWGAMNASHNGAEHCLFFLPDPWTASEIACPDELNDLLDPLRYFSKNYLAHSNTKISKQLVKLLRLLISHGLGGTLAIEIPRLLKNLCQFKGEHFVFISFLDYLSMRLFLKYRDKYAPDFSLIFLNSLAHLQHHHWRGFNYSKNKRLRYGLNYLDRALGHLFTSLGSEDILIVTNALSQKNTNEEKPWILYRQYDQSSFLKTVGIYPSHVESHMTHDAHVYFENEIECEQAKSALEKAQVLDQKLFLVETYSQNPKKLFYRIQFTDQIPSNTHFTLGGKSYPFFDLFKPIVQRTGKHIPYGTIYSNAKFPKVIQNHEIFDSIEKLMTR